MKHKSMSQMNKERKRKPMTVEEEYRNADVPMPYNAGVAYTSFLKIFKEANGDKTKDKD